jgi:hypothetical protein
VTLVLVDDTLAIQALISPEPARVDGVETLDLVVTYSMWQRVLDAIAKSAVDPTAHRGKHLSRLIGLEHLATQPDPDRLRIVNPVNNQWPAALRKAQKPWSNALRADWVTTAEAVEQAGGQVLLSDAQAPGLHSLWPTAVVASVDVEGEQVVLRPNPSP